MASKLVLFLTGIGFLILVTIIVVLGWYFGVNKPKNNKRVTTGSYNETSSTEEDTTPFIQKY